MHKSREGRILQFSDREIDDLDLLNETDFCTLFIWCLCGRRYKSNVVEDDKDEYQRPSRHYTGQLLRPEEWEFLRERMRVLGENEAPSEASQSEIKVEQLNEILLLLNQDRVSQGFFSYFFGESISNDSGLKAGISKFRGMALLRYANIRYAFNHLKRMSFEEIQSSLANYDTAYNSCTAQNLSQRPPEILGIKKIDKQRTWYLGEITGSQINKEADYLAKCCSNSEELNQEEVSEIHSFFDIEDGDKEEVKKIEDGLNKLQPEYNTLTDELKETIKTALENTDVYLTWDFMDVYFATSMRAKSEFEECYEFIDDLSRTDHLKEFWRYLRVFDPTQSKCENRIEKGLLEGLMLKRVLCTIYMAQETDTIGKDSELAATLAQGKPVIAYVPRLDPQDVSEIKKLSIDLIWKRFLFLMAANQLKVSILRTGLNRIGLSVSDIDRAVTFALEQLTEYMKKRIFQSSSKSKENDVSFIKKNGDEFDNLIRIMTLAQSSEYDNKARVLNESHPLALQTNLSTGVANGVLVVRDIETCAKVLRSVLEKKMQFIIERLPQENGGALVLREEITDSIFRVQTDYERLSNSFWNHYFRDTNIQ